jgi:aromatic ring-opening dioxygenase LigB subunit
MPLVYACIAPHGGELVPRLAGDMMARFAKLRKGMRTVAAQMTALKPDTIVIASPHNLRLHKHIGVVLSEHSSGSTAEGMRRIFLRADCDTDLAWAVLHGAEKRGLPVVGANYGTFEGRLSDLAMDWGTLVPLWFFKKEKGLKSRLVIATPSREIALRDNFEFGRVIAKVAERERKRVAFVASADQAHAHRKSGPYGFSPKAEVYDRLVAKAINEGRLKSVLDLPSRLVAAAKPDSLWQMAMLAGVLEEVEMKGELICYDVPTYYGMLCAGYVRTSQWQERSARSAARQGS